MSYKMRMNRMKIVLSPCILFLSQQVMSADEIKAIPWVKVKTETEQLKIICKQLKINCSNDLGIWKAKSSKDNRVYLIDNTPQLFELERENNIYKIRKSWNFKDYQHHSKNLADDELADDGTEVFPAFYPLNQQKIAIALVKHYATSYSGGGKGEHIADFILLEPQGKFRTALADIPFYSYEMIRACFSEKEYRTSPHCHDESGSNLSIQFKDVGKPYYQWTLNYTDFTWESFKPEKSKTITKSRVVVMPFGQKVK